jgi:hypothetical protein
VGLVRLAEPAEKPFRLGAAGRADRLEDTLAALGQLGEGGPPITGVGPAPGQPAGLDGVHDLRVRARGDVQMTRQRRRMSRSRPQRRDRWSLEYDHGRIAEAGTHGSLLAGNGRYAALAA